MARVYKGYCMIAQVEITDDMIQKIADGMHVVWEYNKSDVVLQPKINKLYSAKLYSIFLFIMVFYDDLIKMLKNYFIFICSDDGDAKSCRWVTEWHWDP